MSSSSVTFTRGGAISSALENLSQNANLIGGLWLMSSAIFTTYSTNAFLEYGKSPILSPEKLQRHSNSVGRQVSKGMAPIGAPTLLTFYRFAGSLLLGLVLHPDARILQRITDTWKAIPAFILPATLLFIANLCNSISLKRIGISLTYTSKCGIPIITALLTLLLDGANSLPGPLALISLLPIAFGIAAASWNAPTVDTLGFLAAFVSTTAQSALNVTAKKAMAKTGCAGPSAQRVMVAVGLVLVLLLTSVQSMLTPVQDRQVLGNKEPTQGMEHPPVWLTVAAFTAYHIEYVLSFCFVRLVQPITYGALDAVRRLSIILVGRAMFGGKPLTYINVFGIVLAVLGATLYSIATSLS